MKDTQINIRLSSELFNILNLKSIATNRTNSDYIRSLILNTEISINEEKDIVKLINSINHIGNNINQIARTLNKANLSNKLNDVQYEKILNRLIVIESNLSEILRASK